MDDEKKIECKAQENLRHFKEFQSRFDKACETIGIDEKQGSIFLDILGNELFINNIEEELVLAHMCRKVKGLAYLRINWELRTKDDKVLYLGNREGLEDYLTIHKNEIKRIYDLTDFSLVKFYTNLGIEWE